MRQRTAVALLHSELNNQIHKDSKDQNTLRIAMNQFIHPYKHNVEKEDYSGWNELRGRNKR